MLNTGAPHVLLLDSPSYFPAFVWCVELLDRDESPSK